MQREFTYHKLLTDDFANYIKTGDVSPPIQSPEIKEKVYNKNIIRQKSVGNGIDHKIQYFDN